VKYELDLYIPEEGILDSHRRESLKSFILSWPKFVLADHQPLQSNNLKSVGTNSIEIAGYPN
jgi:hypothetical protein